MTTAEWTELLKRQFPNELSNILMTRERRIFAETTLENLVKVVGKLKENKFTHISAITGLDLGEQFEVIYHLSTRDGQLLNLKVYTPREKPLVPSVAPIFPGVFLYERELMDLYGIEVDGTPPNRRYPLPDDWPNGEFPLRKDWKGLPQEGEVKNNG